MVWFGYRKNTFFTILILGIGIISLCYSRGFTLTLITDNSDTISCIVSPIDGWSSSTYGGIYGSDKLYTTRGDGSKTVTWITKLPIGRFNVKAWVNSAPYASDAHYLVIHSGVTSAVTRSQNYAGGNWCVDLGTYDFDTVGIVVLSDSWTGLGNYVVADAVKFDLSSTMGISWNTSSSLDAISLATTQGKPILLYFSTEKSIECQKMAGETFIDSTLIKWLDKFIRVRIELESNPDPMRIFHVYNVPTIIILDSEGHEKKRITGFISADDLVKVLNTQLGIMGQ